MLLRTLIAAVSVLALAASPALGADPRQGDQWGLEMVKGPEAWKTSTGVGTVVAVIDTGVQVTHPDLGDRLLSGFDYVGDDPIKRGDEDTDPKDGDGHGTHVTGIVAANAGNGEGIAGVAPGAKVLPIRVLDDNGEGYADDTIKAIEYAIEKGVHVINLSLGDYVPLQSALLGDPAYADALQKAVDSGIVVVIAAGNNNLPRCENPDVAGIICVGAVDRQGRRSPFSSHSDGVDLMAPGGVGPSVEDSDNVLSTYTNSGYAYVAGTSQATPHVAGVAALLVSLGVRGQDAAARITATASDPPPLTISSEYGAGIVDAAAAVAGLGTPPPPPPPGPGPQPEPPPAKGSYTTAKTVRAAAIRRRGFRVKCKAVRPGPCKIAVRYRGRKIAVGRTDVPADLATRVSAPLNRRGKKTLKALRRKIRVRVSVTLPGEAVRSRRVTVRR